MYYTLRVCTVHAQVHTPIYVCIYDIVLYLYDTHDTRHELFGGYDCASLLDPLHPVFITANW